MRSGLLWSFFGLPQPKALLDRAAPLNDPVPALRARGARPGGGPFGTSVPGGPRAEGAEGGAGRGWRSGGGRVEVMKAPQLT